MLLTDLIQVKRLLEIHSLDISEDAALLIFITQVSGWIEEFLGRGDLAARARTEFYRGTGTKHLVLRSRPILASPTPRVWVDTGGYYGAASGSFADGSELTYGTDFTVRWDQPDGTSRCGILENIRGCWYKPTYRQLGLLTSFIGDDQGSVKVTYTAGWTPDTLPEPIRAAANLGVAKLRYIFPVGIPIGSEAYEDRTISTVEIRKGYIMSMVRPLIVTYRNWALK